MTCLLSGWGNGAGGRGRGSPPALVLSLMTLHNVWKSWHHRLLMGIKHGYLIVNVILGTTILDPSFNLIYRISRGVVGRMLEFREWACKWEGYSFLGVKSNSILSIPLSIPRGGCVKAWKGTLQGVHSQDYLMFQSRARCWNSRYWLLHIIFRLVVRFWRYIKKICPTWSLSFSSLTYPLLNTIRPFIRGK